jgi:hypothetical protein
MQNCEVNLTEKANPGHIKNSHAFQKHLISEQPKGDKASFDYSFDPQFLPCHAAHLVTYIWPFDLSLHLLTVYDPFSWSMVYNCGDVEPHPGATVAHSKAGGAQKE